MIMIMVASIFLGPGVDSNYLQRYSTDDIFVDTSGYRVEEIYDPDQRDFTIFGKHSEGSSARIAKYMLREFLMTLLNGVEFSHLVKSACQKIFF